MVRKYTTKVRVIAVWKADDEITMARISFRTHRVAPG